MSTDRSSLSLDFSVGVDMHFLQILFLTSAAAATMGLQCMSPEGKPVDWYALYKLPELRHNKSNPMLHVGLGVFYMDGDNTEWTLSSGPVNDTHGALYQTLEPVYKSGQADSLLYMFYNDQPPPHRDYLSYGHTKGALAFSEQTGFWLVQSTPHFPSPVKEGFAWPESGLDCGQSFLCISFPTSCLADIAQQLYFNNPKVYDYSLPEQFKKEVPYLEKVLQDEHPTSAPWTRLQELESLAGNKFLSFAKYKEFDAELYSDFVAPTLGASLLVETWQNGPEKLPSNCTLPHQVFNVEEIALPDGVTFEESKDHSKWAVTFSSDNSQAWVCIGDINRQGHQMHRGGGTVCFQNKGVWQSYRSSVSKYETCPAPHQEL